MLLLVGRRPRRVPGYRRPEARRPPRQNKGLKVANRGGESAGVLPRVAYSVVPSAPHSGAYGRNRWPRGRLAARCEMVRLQPAPKARAAPPYPRSDASGELPRMGKLRTVGRVSTGQFARSLRRARIHAE